VDAAALAREVLGGFGGDEAAARPLKSGDRKDQRGKKWEAAGRARPGAALAMAKREKVGIVPGQGTKISFD
jgi:NAD/NADP transhydrogenase beta subunit